MEIIKHPIESIFAVYLGNKNEIQEMALCQKEIDENGIITYTDLLTKTKYHPTSSNETEVIALREFTLLGILKQTTMRNKILENKYLTNQDLLLIYDAINEDKQYKTNIFYAQKRNSLFEFQGPAFIATYKKNEKLYIDETEETITQIIMSKKTSKKIIVITGKNGVGKSTIKDKSFLFEKINENVKKANITCWCTDYNNIIKDTITNVNIQNRINKIAEFIENFREQTGPNLCIDNVNFSNTFFIEQITKLAKDNDIFLILISSTRLDQKKLDQNIYKVIEIKSPTIEAQKQIYHKVLELETNEKSLPIAVGNEEIINILLECDKSNCINQSNYTKNPKLAITIIKNAFTHAIANFKKEVEIDDFIEALYQDNINMDLTTKEEIKKAFDDLKKKNEEQQTLLPEQPKQKKFPFWKK